MRGFNALAANLLAAHNVANAAAAPAAGGVTPTAPGPSDVFKEGSDCVFKWTPDTSGQWKETNVELMTGDNFHMVHITSESCSVYAHATGHLES